MESPRALRLPALLALVAGGALGVLATGAGAQYFGGNKVRYEQPEFRVLASEHFDLYHYEEEEAGARAAAVLAERWYGRLSPLLEHQLTDRQPLILYAGHPHFRQTNATPGEIGEGTGGFTEMFKRRVVLPFAGPARETDHVIGHELVHAFQFDVFLKPRPDGRRGSIQRLPLWFIEGMAEYLSLGSVDAHTAMWMRDAVAQDDLPTLQKLGNPKYFPYRYGHAFWAYVAGRYGDAAVGKLLMAVAKSGDVATALKTELKVDHKKLSEEWHAALKQHFGPAVTAAHPAADYGRALVEGKRRRGQFNLSPALSPDGRRLLFFSERSLFSIELYLLDVESGEVLRTLTRTATDPHFDSLQFLQSAGAWSPDGRRIAIGSVGRGRPMLTILDAETGDTVAEHRLPQFVEVLHPAWSPDGRRIAFTANEGGFMQLHLFELETGQTRQLTREAFTAMQPAWSPDGKSLAFATDRFTSDAKRQVYGDFRLARLDLASGAVTPLPGLEGGKNINPQWGADGKLYFLSDARAGVNLYRLDVASGAIEALTDLKTGISGLTRLSPALSVASQAPNRIAASVFEKGMYHIYLLDKPRGAAVARARDPQAPAPGALPPRERVEPRVDALLAQTTPAPGEVKTSGPEEYRPRLGVDTISQTNAVVGASSAGSFYGGGIALFWSDMLGDHNLLTLAQIEGDTETIDRNFAAVINYENRKSRWVWGAGVGQIPSRSAGYAVDFGTFNGEPARRDRLIRQWEISRELAGRIAYPFTRADRFEFSAGYRRISYITDSVERIVSLNDGRVLAEGTFDLPSPDPIDQWPADIAFVHDTSVFGGTAPAAGTRYRIELGGALGDISYYAPLVDYRRYLLPFPYLTLAGRVLHYGRYGTNAEDPRLSSVFVGSPLLVRGYTIDSFLFAECDPAAAPACPAFDQLFGSRLAVGNVEARVPVFGARGLVHTPAVPPIDFAVFYDAGVAWTSDQSPGGARDLVRSYGASIRLNLFGVIALQWNYVEPIDRPLKDWHWEWLIAPGF